MKSIHGLTATLAILFSFAAENSFAGDPHSFDRRIIDMITDRMISKAEPIGRKATADDILEIYEKTPELDKRNLLLSKLYGDECTEYKTVPESCNPSVMHQRIKNAKYYSSAGSPGDEGVAAGLESHDADAGK